MVLCVISEGYQLNSADCMDIRYNKSVAEHLCHSFPENTKPTPKLKECNMDPCLERLVLSYRPSMTKHNEWRMNLSKPEHVCAWDFLCISLWLCGLWLEG